MLAVQCHMQHWWQVKTTTVPPKGFTGCTGDTFKAVRVCVDSQTAYSPGHWVHYQIVNKNNHAWLFFLFFFFLQQLLQRQDTSRLLCYSTECVRLHAVRAVVSDGRRRHRGTPTSESRKSKSINNVGLQKLHSNLSPAECERVHQRGRGASRPFSPAEPRCDRGAQKNTLPKCSPSRHRRNNMSAKDGHVLLVMSTRGGGKVDSMFPLSAFSHHAHSVSKWNLNTGNKTSYLQLGGRIFPSTQVL